MSKTLKNGAYTAPLPPGKYRAFAVDKVRDVAKSELVEVAEGGMARVDLSMPQPGDLRVVVRDEKGQRARYTRFSVPRCAAPCRAATKAPA